MTFARRVLAAAVCVPLLLAGCSDDPEPQVAPPSETPASASPSAPPAPEPWQKKTNAGAVAFAKHWIDVFSDAMRSGRTDQLAALNGPDCDTCTNVVDRIASVYEAGGEYRTDGWKVLQADAVSDESGNASVAMNVRRSAEVFRESSRAEPQSNPVSRASYSAQLGWKDGGWQMLRLDLAT